MKNLFFIISLILGIFATSQIAFASDTLVNVCNGDTSCRALIQATERAPKSTKVPLVCMEFAQARRGPVVLTIYGEDGRKIRRLAKIAGTNGQFCIGKQWLTNAKRIDLCNAVKTRTAQGEVIREMKETGRTRARVPLFAN